MDVLEYHYMSCSFGFLTTTNGFLTSLALLTAVVSFWKLRSFATPPPATHESSSSQVPPPLDRIATETSQLSSDIDKQVPTTAATYSCSSVVSNLDTIIEEEEDADMTKSSTTTSPRKYTVMYYSDVDNGEDETTLFECGRDVIDYDENSTSIVEASPLLRTIKGNNGLDWYRYQDLSVLNGNVVKLWDCKKQRKNSLASSSLSAGIR